jgi:glutathione synthase/RimK-type ligase-like ATP-grasp enzyme
MILIVSMEQDPHADRVEDVLRDRDVRFVRLNTSEFPEEIAAAIGISEEGEHIEVRKGAERLNVDDISAVWYRRPEPPKVSTRMTSQNITFSNNESFQFLSGMWLLLQDRLWVNPFEAGRAADAKPYQLAVARQVGFTVPSTLMTNDPSRALEFVRGLNGPAIYKAFTPYDRSTREGPVYGIFTTLITEEQIASRMDSIRRAPCIFQEYVEKHLEIRVTVVGTDIFAAEIHSQQSERSRIDWRRYDLANTPYAPHDLPKRVVERIFALMSQLRLRFACIDLVLRPDGEYVFLELNPSGQWYWVEQLTGLPITERLVEVLAAGERVNSVQV